MSWKFRTLRALPGLVLALSGGLLLAWAVPMTGGGCVCQGISLPDGGFAFAMMC